MNFPEPLLVHEPMSDRRMENEWWHVCSKLLATHKGYKQTLLSHCSAPHETVPTCFPQFRHGRCGSSSKATQRSLIGTNRGCKLQTRCQSSIRSNGDPEGYHEGSTYMTTARWWPRLGETALFKAVLPYCWLPRRRWPILGETAIPVAVLPKLSAAAKAVAVG